MCNAKVACSTPELLWPEKQHLREVFSNWSTRHALWTEWNIRTSDKKLNTINNNNSRNSIIEPSKWARESLLYLTCKVFVTILRISAVSMTLRHLSKILERKDTTKSKRIYWDKSNRLNCNVKYKGESARAFCAVFKEYIKAPPPTYGHQSTTCHTTALDNFNTVGREGPKCVRRIKQLIL